ncbi:MAG: transposase [Chloroflexi bacterium]|nr:transposase [Chloroflexota bacterium]
MPNFKRNYFQGGTYFFTLVTYKRVKIFLDDICTESFFDALGKVKDTHHFELLAYCVLPDHIHLLMTLDNTDSNFSSRIKEIKRKATLAIREHLQNPSLHVWQDRFWEHTIRDDNDLKMHFDYIHYNPIKHGYSEKYDWKWSSYWRFYGNDGEKAPSINSDIFMDPKYFFGE